MTAVRRRIRPLTSRNRGKVAAILTVFALSSALGVGLSVRDTAGSRNRAIVVEVAARQRALAERYVKDTMLARAHHRADPVLIGSTLRQSAEALLDGGVAPAVDGDDDQTSLPPAHGKQIRAQLGQELALIGDLTAVGDAILTGHGTMPIVPSANEHLGRVGPLERLRILAALTSNVSLNASRSLAHAADSSIANLITTQVLLGVGGLLVSLLFGFALMRTTRRQSAHFRSLVRASTDLVLVFSERRCRYASPSIERILGRPDGEMLGAGFLELVEPEDRPAFEAAVAGGRTGAITLRVAASSGGPRHLEAHVTDLRGDRDIRGVVMNARDVTERVQLERELTRQAFHDQLTSLPNRALFNDRLAQALARSMRTHDAFAVLLVDLDGFKRINDSLGHDVGDHLIKKVGKRFEDVTRPSDTLARLGGDEFALLVEGIDEGRAVEVATRLLDCLTEPVLVAGQQLPVAASIGVVMHAGAGHADDLMRHADLAMYAAKENGRGRHELYSEEMARGVGELIGLERELHLGLLNGEFALHYQPEIDLSTNAVVGVEALLRWTSPARGSIPPSTFIPAAETTGMIIPLGEFVLREACRQAAEWRAEGVLPDPFVMWINVSGVQLSSGGIAATVEGVLAETGLPPALLGLEITETAIVAEGTTAERAQQDLQRLHRLGVRLAIDDFGTGFSALGQLRRFPIDVIKVDRSFVQGLEDHAKDAAITANLVNLAHALGIRAIAEGVESDAQVASLQDLGCDLAQGFLFARPAPPEEVRAQLVAGPARAAYA